MASKKVNSMARGLKILESFTPDSLRLSLAEISRITDTPKATAFRLLKTLTELNYLKHDPVHKEYYLGPKVLSLGYSVLQSMDIREIIRPYLTALSKECKKTVTLAVLDDTEMVYIERLRAPDIVYLDITIGSRIPLYNTAVGKAVLAYMEDQALADILEKISSDPDAAPFIENRQRLFRTLNQIRNNGYAVSDEEYRKGVCAIAVPVLNSKGVIGGINLVVSSDSASGDELKKRYAELMIRTGKEISEALGYIPIRRATR